jgi:hypothetical protein
MVASKAVTPSVASITRNATSAASRCLRAITTLSFSAISLVLPLRRMPAVSMMRYFLPSRMTTSSTASRVVPAIGETMARCLPVSRLSSVDLPTFGRPMMAIFTSSGRAERASTSSDSPSIAISSADADAGSISGKRRCAAAPSNSSMMPKPCSAETKNDSFTPSRCTSVDSCSARSDSILLMASSSGLPERCRMRVSSMSGAVNGARPSTTRTMTSASSMPTFAWL